MMFPYSSQAAGKRDFVEVFGGHVALTQACSNQLGHSGGLLAAQGLESPCRLFVEVKLRPLHVFPHGV